MTEYSDRMWAEAISDAGKELLEAQDQAKALKRRVFRLQYAIRTFKQLRRDGAEWPTEEKSK